MFGCDYIAPLERWAWFQGFQYWFEIQPWLFKLGLHPMGPLLLVGLHMIKALF